ncbi:50S ribosomal protein L25/general stress protein Ctc [Oceaniserpentilla sp. 4NH20-0058]|uniref:50S ribosomal protein L25/general stress protein Ctc n=1 Tax=Oceaniserpentilla sp. 4NH20-0058 TaxID=3127660 RepID=UPI0031035A79
MTNFELNAEVREVKGKGASRRLRREAGKTPGIVYGGDKEPTQVTLELKELNKAFEDEGFFSHIIKLNVAGGTESVLIKDVQRHPYKPVVLHVDFQRVSNTTIIKQHIPLHFINEESCKGVKLQGGKVKHTISDVMVICEAGKLPEFIEVDLKDAEVGTILHLSDLVLPEGVEILELTHGSDHDAAVVSIDIPKGVAADEEDGAEEAPAE